MGLRPSGAPAIMTTPTPAQTQPARGLHVITWGCQMNVYDSARMGDVLRPLGYQPVDAPDNADMIILNTCHIRDRAAEKVFSELGRLRLVKEARKACGQNTIIAVAGCVAQAEGQEILARAPYVDIVLGPQTYHRLPEMVARAARAGGAVIETDFPAEQKFDFLPDTQAPQTPGNYTAFLTIQEGCDKFCSFCVVPYTRGAESSRNVTSVLAEARRMAASGVRDISLLGQNVNAYHGEGPDGTIWNLAKLAYALAEIPGLSRIRYTTSHPRDMDGALIAAHRDLPQLMPFLHLPVQSGSDRILRAMNRGHTADEYRDIVRRLREARPDMALSSDFIVGHPGETDEDFEATMQLVRDIGFALAYSFKYSPRPGTPAAGAGMQVPEDVKDARLQALQHLLRTQQDAFNATLVGRSVPVLFTSRGRKPGQITGRSPWLQPIHVTGPESLIGQELCVHVTERLTNSLGGVLEERKVYA
ncbi:tRNA (N6-isopentenyl adenosine(37)-C2)-methylthiotransferase MiaB [Acetobacter sp. TBRC 12305]|uniref:tRNA-2-methylthio-N(6)-dimethylallyladenosine synthase n=1 Tax=Acetobacter garciniae TaxID=2817435 RepID=A0A939KLA5_9PROT|nr:tRNA (N6-isopentenyl adenosine(37)-C2)-methylthiotransferase MiaB [Acetobacter garciniae]MBO1324068.1 tRNA (N6-isopentenyl adenosine(37)-C2)-methylthiotransferase MiaB [Acetobacter garciniae]MBX0343757.1 tRNA (N6-isopentenyl adenosine(37)-C2)-methylthiotransferase MiaB [Acetobacter garciniae]